MGGGGEVCVYSLCMGFGVHTALISLHPCSVWQRLKWVQTVSDIWVIKLDLKLSFFSGGHACPMPQNIESQDGTQAVAPHLSA